MKIPSHTKGQEKTNMKNITSANTEIYQMLKFCDKGFFKTHHDCASQGHYKEKQNYKISAKNNRYKREWKL